MSGTLKELTGKVELNGHVLTTPQLSSLFKLANGTFCREVGKVEKKEGQRGRAASIWEVDDSVAVKIEVTA